MNDDIEPWEILVEAAQLIDSYEVAHCCEATNIAARELLIAENSDGRLPIRQLCDVNAYLCAEESFSLLAPRNTMDQFEAWWDDYSEDSQAERVLALLFAAEISKDKWK